ncbi:MAG: DUF5050 domain-containing protein [Spirosomataceae bacterium]
MKPICSIAILLLSPMVVFAQNPVGIFDNHTDIGKVVHAGTATYDAASQTYQLSGSGENSWFKKDELHFAYKKLKGDFILQVNASLIGKGTDPHRKIGWMARTSLDTSAAMVSVTVHGDGLAAFQYRKIANTNMEEVKSPIKNPDVLQLERRGRSYFMAVAKFGQPFWTVEIPDFAFPEELLVGLFICAHNKQVIEQATFHNVRIVVPAKPNFVPYREYIGSHLEVLDIESGHRTLLYSENASLQAPNWTPDGKHFIYNKSNGLLYRYRIDNKEITQINTDFVKRNNNDHVISFDGKMLGLSSGTDNPADRSLIYTVSIEGGTPTLITPKGPSYLHSFSPDGRWLTFTAERGDGNFDIYKVPTQGGAEVRLTTSQGLDDGSEYSPDGKYIYFNSTRSGTMQLWRMKPNGQDQKQLTDDELNNWFPHLSPDGKWIVFLSYQPEVKPDDHPFYKHVYLRIMPANGGKPKVIAYFYGGQGSINTPSWSPDSKKVAFISNSQL